MGASTLSGSARRSLPSRRLRREIVQPLAHECLERLRLPAADPLDRIGHGIARIGRTGGTTLTFAVMVACAVQILLRLLHGA